MKTLILPVIALLILTACGEPATTRQQQTRHNRIISDTSAIYEEMTDEICTCITSTMRNNKPSTTGDSCYEATIKKSTNVLKSIGCDPATIDGQGKLFSNINMIGCGNLSQLIVKEAEEEEAKKLLFKGQFVSQKKLATGEYEITLSDNKTSELKRLKSKDRFDEESVKNFLPGYELTIEYEIVKNAKTGKDELYKKRGGLLNVLGTVLKKEE